MPSQILSHGMLQYSSSPAFNISFRLDSLHHQPTEEIKMPPKRLQKRNPHHPPSPPPPPPRGRVILPDPFTPTAAERAAFRQVPYEPSDMDPEPEFVTALFQRQDLEELRRREKGKRRFEKQGTGDVGEGRGKEAREAAGVRIEDDGFGGVRKADGVERLRSAQRELAAHHGQREGGGGEDEDCVLPLETQRMLLNFWAQDEVEQRQPRGYALVEQQPSQASRATAGEVDQTCDPCKGTSA